MKVSEVISVSTRNRRELFRLFDCDSAMLGIDLLWAEYDLQSGDDVNGPIPRTDHVTHNMLCTQYSSYRSFASLPYPHGAPVQCIVTGGRVEASHDGPALCRRFPRYTQFNILV